MRVKQPEQERLTMKRSVCCSLGLVLAVTGCGNNGGTQTSCFAVTGTTHGKAIINTLTLPTKSTEYALDLDNDNGADNQLGKIISIIKTLGGMGGGAMLDPQSTVNMQLAMGNANILIDQSGTSLTDADCARVDLSTGKSTPNMAPTAGGTYMVDPTNGTGTFYGKLAAGQFNSNSPVTATADQEPQVTVSIPLLGSMPILVHLHAAHLQLTRAADGSIMKGQINGAIRNDDLQTSVIPSVASLLTGTITSGGMSAGQIESIFDTGGSAQADSTCTQTTTCAAASVNMGDKVCKNLDGSCSQACDMKISPCEVSTNTTIAGVLMLDVSLFGGVPAAGGAFGAYKPSPTAPKDSMSVGLSFTGINASF
jgi:hypothetical protein